MFLSIGYATCHWCHVMAHESFEDDAVAQLLNDSFVCIKVDREERPDIDAAYMAACQAANGSGGWPLNAVLDHAKKPWFVGTYFPKTTRGRIGMLDLVPTLRDAWENKRADVQQSAEHLLEHAQVKPTVGDPDPHWVTSAVAALADRFDAQNGGFGSAPKFPSPHQIELLLEHHQETGDAAARAMALQTLDGIWRGGIHDHVGGGFHRYSTDAKWLVPHFEKMLYDQASLMRAFAAGAHQEPRFAAAVDDIAEYVRRDLRHKNGAFFSAEDADSEGEEGTFYIWTKQELDEVLGDAADAFCATYGVLDDGNFRDEASGKQMPQNILHQPAAAPPSQTQLRQLLAVREKRTRPLLDDKILAAWNGMMIGALAQAGRNLSKPELVKLAAGAADFVLAELLQEGKMSHRWHEGNVDRLLFLDDLAWMADGCIELFQSDSNPRWLVEAKRLTDNILADFVAPNGALNLSPAGAEEMVLQRTDAYDGATASGTSVALGVFDKLSRLTGDQQYTDAAWALLRAIAGEINRMPSAYCALLSHASHLQNGAMEIVVTGTDELANQLWLEACAKSPAGAVVIRLEQENSSLFSIAPWLADYAVDQTGAYVCRNQACAAPVRSVRNLRSSLLSG